MLAARSARFEAGSLPRSMWAFRSTTVTAFPAP
jgi:hypothetical protein